jgi:hypothetical protein
MAKVAPREEPRLNSAPLKGRLGRSLAVDEASSSTLASQTLPRTIADMRRRSIFVPKARAQLAQSAATPCVRSSRLSARLPFIA